MDGPPAGFSTREVVREPPLSAAVRVVVCAAATVAAVAVKVAEEKPAGTVTAAGTASAVLLDVTLTAAPPEGARPVRIKVHVLEPAGARLDGTHATEMGATGGTTSEAGAS